MLVDEVLQLANGFVVSYYSFFGDFGESFYNVREGVFDMLLEVGSGKVIEVTVGLANSFELAFPLEEDLNFAEVRPTDHAFEAEFLEVREGDKRTCN